MTQNGNIWNLLVTSDLVSAEKVTEIRTHCQEELGSSAADDTQKILDWLRDKNRISNFQMQVLAEGAPGPFRFEQYLVHTKIVEPPFEGAFRARHIGSNHPVRLCFFGGSEADDAVSWNRIREWSQAASQITSPFVIRCFERVEETSYRFVVFEDSPGRTLQVKLPAKARLPWPQTLQAIELLTLGLKDIHAANRFHGAIHPNTVWLQRNGICQLIWVASDLLARMTSTDDETAAESSAYQTPSQRKSGQPIVDVSTGQRSDLFAIGGLLFRMLTGKDPRFKTTDPAHREVEIEKHLEYCKRYELPEPVSQLMSLFMKADISGELKDAATAAKIAGSILESQSIKADVDADPASLASYLEALDQKQRSRGFLSSLENLGETSEPPNGTNAPGMSGLEAVVANESAISTRERLARRKKKQPKWLPLGIGVGILLAAVMIGGALGGWFQSSQQQAQLNPANASPVTSEGDEGTVDVADRTTSKTPASVYRPQLVVENNDQVAWESPTSGGPIDVSLMPAAPDFIFAIKPERLQTNPQGEKLLKAMGPALDSLQTELLTATQIPFDEIHSLTVSLHQAQPGTYEQVAVLEWNQPITQNDLWERLGKPTVQKNEEAGVTLFELDELLIYFPTNDQEEIERLAIGNKSFLEASLSSLGPLVAGREVGKLIDRSDRERDLIVIFRKPALLSEEGRWLFSGKWAGLRRPLDLFLDDRLEAVMLSLHFDKGSYLEWMSEQTTEMSNRDLAKWIPAQLTQFRDDITTVVSQIPPNPYWSKVQQRFDNMIVELVREVRVAIEPGGVIANCWLPESAPHNLVAASELVLNGPEFSAESAPSTKSPQTLEALLATPRDLVVTSDPDLINLLRAIEQEVRDDFPNLPFDFRIRLLGNDLGTAGITQNQRPGKVEAKQKPLGDILAQIMLQANPDKSASQPSDITCKLIYVIGPDPESPENEAVLITTREAANQRNLPLPEIFRPRD